MVSPNCTLSTFLGRGGEEKGGQESISKENHKSVVDLDFYLCCTNYNKTKLN